MRKFLAMLLTLALVLSLAVPAFAEGEKSDDIVILYTNDVHTYIDGDLSYDVIAAIKAEYQAQYNNVLLVDAGDHIQGTAYGSMDKGATIIKLMNAAGYDLATLGNHEFDYGMDGCINARQWANFPYISCNFYNEKDGVRGENVLDSYKLFTFGGQTVAIIGMTTPETFTKSTPAYFQDAEGNYIYGIGGGEDGSALYADVQKAIDDAKAAGATVIIGLGHLGDDPASQPWTSLETIANVSGLDAFIDGHSHSTIQGKTVADKDGNNVLLTQTGEYFNRIGVMIIDGETGEITTDFIEATTVAPNADVKAIKDAWLAEIDTQLGQKIGSTELVLDNYDENDKRLVRKQETNTGDFCADALYYLFDNMDMDVDVAIMNGGGVRNKAVTGELTYKVCKNIHTFGNVACLQTITGQQLLDALEWGARGVGTGEEIGGFLHVSGITYKIDTTIESTVQMDEKGVWAGAPTGEYRVHSVMVYNKETQAYEPLDLDAKYNLAGYNYTLRDLGDGFAMFDGAVNVLDYVMEDYMVLANYVKGYENGIVGAKNSPLLAKYENLLMDYATVNGSGRILMEAKQDEDPTVPTTKPDIGDNAPTGDVSIVIYTVLALASTCGMGLVIGKKKF
jgi:2',3'-cyclic-nucleotide 2'-phosphodiesterase (5'-nucleotidase family)